ncbi:MAG: HNH endonuclease, partial [Candidatus Peribacteraceae bacterium]|nr:HNH endonuclease [Candidatus Peribacteraceae bacterium]
MNRKAVTCIEKIRRDAKETTTPDASEWTLWKGEAMDGHFWCDECIIDDVRTEFLKRNQHPKVILKDESRIKSLRYTFTRADKECGTCIIHAMPSDAFDIMKWLDKLDCSIKYRGEGLPSISYKVLVKLVRTKERRYLEGEEKHALMEDSFGYVCAICGERGRMEWDHINRFSQSFGEQETDSFQPLCLECHRMKSNDEPTLFDEDPLSSHVDRMVWDEYVMSERPPPLVYKFQDVENLDGCRIVDVRRCRFRALLLNTHQIPLLSPLDGIQKCDNTLGDLNFVTKRTTNFQAQLGYTGPGWQHRVQTEFLMYMGILTWDDIAYKITASSHLPANILKAPLERMEAAWVETGALGKQSANSMIGTFALDECFSYKHYSSNYEGDAPAGALKRTTHFDDGYVTDYIVKTKLLSTTTLRPLHDLCMCTEAVRVGQMLYCLRKQRAVIYEVKTDSVLYKPGKKPKHVLEDITFKDLHVRDIFEPAGQVRLDQHFTPALPDSDLLVYRAADAEDKDLMKMKPDLPKRDTIMTWCPIKWRELTEEEAEREVLEG